MGENSFVGFPGRMEERALGGGGSLAFRSLFMEDGSRSDGGSERREDMGAASMMLDSRDAHLQSSSRASGGSRGHVPAYSHLSEERRYGAARQSLIGMGGSSSEHVGSSSSSSSSRSAAGKRKSYAPMEPRGNISSRSGYIGRTGGSTGMSGVGGSSWSLEALGSSTSPSDEVFLGRYGEVPAMAEDPVPRRVSFGGESSSEGRYGKSVAGSSSGIPNSQRISRSGANGAVLNSFGSLPFPRTMRRAMPSHENLPRRTPIPDSPMADDDLGTSSSCSLCEQMPQRSEGPVVGGGRLRRSEGTFGGDRAMSTYLENSTRGGAAGLRSRHSHLMSQSAPHPGGPSGPPPPHPPSLRGRLHGSSLLPPPSASGSGPSRLAPTPPSRMLPKPSSVDPLSAALMIDSLPSPAALPRGSSMHGSSPGGIGDREFMSAAASVLRTQIRGLQISAGDARSRPRLGPEILSALERLERDEDLTHEQLSMLEETLLDGGMDLHDEHSDMRLDVDDMSYEELLALEERIGNVSTGLTSDAIEQKLKKTWYSSLDAVVARYSQECDIKCSICQEEYEEGDEVGKIECGHGYHWQCIQQWLVQKNQCPICKAAAFS